MNILQKLFSHLGNRTSSCPRWNKNKPQIFYLSIFTQDNHIINYSALKKINYELVLITDEECEYTDFFEKKADNRVYKYRIFGTTIFDNEKICLGTYDDLDKVYDAFEGLQNNLKNGNRCYIMP